MTRRIPDTGGQTPLWLPELILERYFPNLADHDFVIEPSCGIGNFLRAVPAHVPAIGVEIDGEKADAARRLSGRDVIQGDFRNAVLPATPTAIIGNPPFQARIVHDFLSRAYELLPNSGQVGFILPTSFFQTSGPVLRLSERWSMRQDLLPRDIFGRLRTPILFALFSKCRARSLVGFAFYPECRAIVELPVRYRLRLVTNDRPTWQNVVEAALRQLGGEASLEEIYREVEGRRPTPNRFWQPKIRQVLQEGGQFAHVGRGRWALAQYRQAA